ncbi:MAG: PAS domain-containing protein [Verrucomicrobia bacterium]|nr:PAS domain-containing protein [Verrucomicrobiota bacterium]MDA1086379.1 PAS domain-containing protein [Verrucomicrobiota bacterium]
MPSAIVNDPFSELLNGLYDAVLICALDGTIQSINGRAQKLLDYSEADLTGTHVSNVFAGFDAETIVRIIAHLDDGRFTMLDADCIRRDASRFSSETAVSRIYLTDEGELLFTIRNVDKRRRAETVRRVEHDAMRSSGAAMAIADLHGTIQYANPAFFALWDFEEIDDLRDRDIRTLWASPEQAAVLVRAPANGQNWGGELAGFKCDGTMIWVQASAAPNRDAGQNVTGIVYTFIDITARKVAEVAFQANADAAPDDGPGQEMFSGHLNVLSISDVIQLIHGTRESGELYIFSQPRREFGVIDFSVGRIVDASCEDVAGEAAVCRLVVKGGHSFQFVPGDPGVRDCTIRKGTMSILLEATRQFDESDSGAA